MPIEHSVALTSHPSAPSPAVRGIEVEVRRSATALALAFRLSGDLTRIRVPPSVEPRIGADLWRHTCFEAFVAIDGLAGYHELNCSPSGEWTVYSFRGYRDGGPLPDRSLAPEIALRTAVGRLELDALVSLTRLSPDYSSAPLVLGLAAVVEENDGTLSYWALRHPAGRPDFHHADGFALRLESPGPSATPRPA
jgi:hypothetical protein